jgi:hypothetical protein
LVDVGKHGVGTSAKQVRFERSPCGSTPVNDLFLHTVELIDKVRAEESHILALLCAAICRLGSIAWPRIVLLRFTRLGEVHDLAVVYHRVPRRT